MSEQVWLGAKERLEARRLLEARRAEATPRAGTLREDAWAALDEIKRLETSRESWERDAKLYYQNSNFHEEQRHKAERELQEQRERADRLEAALRGMLLSADCLWEEAGGGHDWREACDTARAALAAQPAGK